MTTLSISLPNAMRALIDQQVAEAGYSTASEYIRQLVRKDQKRAAQQRLETLLMEGLDSGKRIEGGDEYWVQKRAKLLKHAEDQA